MWLDHAFHGATLPTTPTWVQVPIRWDSPVQAAKHLRRPTPKAWSQVLLVRSGDAVRGTFGLEHRGLKAKQAQIPKQLSQALIVDWRLGRGYAELDLPSNADLAAGARLAETQEADGRFRRTFAQSLDLCSQPLLQLLDADGSVWMTTNCDLAHALIFGDAGPRDNGCPYPFPIVSPPTTIRRRARCSSASLYIARRKNMMGLEV